MLIGVGAKHAKDELREFIEMTKIPVKKWMIIHIVSVT